MAATIDLSKFTFCGDQLRAVNEMTFENSILKAPAISDYSRVWTGIRAQGEVGFIRSGDSTSRCATRTWRTRQQSTR